MEKWTVDYDFMPECPDSMLFQELKLGVSTSVAGRVIFLRNLGGIIFIKIQDAWGDIQIAIKKIEVTQFIFEFVKKIHIGDIISAVGIVRVTNTGEKTIFCNDCKILTKSIRSLPDKWHGIHDLEIKRRLRYIDLIRNKELQDIINVRFKLFKFIREYLNNNRFIEVETPILHNVAAGASATPFSTFYKAMNTEVYLQIAPELYLKRWIISGYNRVYTIAKCFRNEGLSNEHLPEFTMLEFYHCYINYKQFRKFVSTFIKQLFLHFEPSGIVHKFDVNNIEQITFIELLNKYVGLTSISNIDMLKTCAAKYSINIEDAKTRDEIVEKIYKYVIRNNIINPVLIYDYPPHALAANNPETNMSTKFQIVICGMEVCNCYMELNNPYQLEENFKLQNELHNSGQTEYQRQDNDFIEALYYGLHPCSGFGMGIDRIVSLITNQHSLKDVIPFPFMLINN